MPPRGIAGRREVDPVARALQPRRRLEHVDLGARQSRADGLEAERHRGREEPHEPRAASSRELLELRGLGGERPGVDLSRRVVRAEAHEHELGAGGLERGGEPSAGEPLPGHRPASSRHGDAGSSSGGAQADSERVTDEQHAPSWRRGTSRRGARRRGGDDDERERRGVPPTERHQSSRMKLEARSTPVGAKSTGAAFTHSSAMTSPAATDSTPRNTCANVFCAGTSTSCGAWGAV